MKHIIALITFTLALSSAPAGAEMDPEKLIQYRQNMMENIKNHNSNLKLILEGDITLDGALAMNLDALDKLFADIGTWFPEGSDFGDTNALDAVWDEPEEFQQAVKDAQQALATFNKAASGGDLDAGQAARKQFAKDACGSCHKKFRKKDE